MNLNKNYYNILDVTSDSDEKTIKKSYYKLSFTMHPDKGGDPLAFAEITEAYDILCSEKRQDYDLKSKFGNNYNEYYELFDINVDYDYDKQKQDIGNFVKNEVLNIRLEVDDSFGGKLEYERWVKCKSCDGTGKDMSSKIQIKDINGNVVKTFDAEDGCDFCEGTGKFMDFDCTFCSGKGKVGLNPCKKCNGERRILGKQKLSGIKLEGDEIKIPAMGHHSRTDAGAVGYLLIIKK